MLTMNSIPLNNNNNNDDDDNNNTSETKQEDENTSVPETPLLAGDEEFLSDGSTEEAPLTDYIKPDGMPATPMLRPIAPSPEYALPLDDAFYL